MSFIHILNVADIALITAGLFATVAMMLIGGHGGGPRDEDKSAGDVKRPAKSRD